MTKEAQQARITSYDHIVIHKVTDNILAMHKDGTAIYAIDVIKKPLVMCKECWHGKRIDSADGVFTHMCDISDLKWRADDFCSYGERKESE